MARMQPVRLPQRLPVVLSREEVARLIAACNNLKHQTALSLAYATGLRASEVVSLRVSDVDSGRMTLRVEQGKGRKDRYAMLSPLLLERLRVVVAGHRAQGKMLDGGWLFPGLNLIESLSPRQLNRAVQAAALAAGIDKRVSMPRFATIPCAGLRRANQPRASDWPRRVGKLGIVPVLQVSEFCEEGEQLVIRSKSPRGAVGWCSPGQGLLLDGEVRVQIDLRRLHGLVAQPQRDYRTIDTRLKQLHRGGMAKHVRCDPLWARDGSSGPPPRRVWRADTARHPRSGECHGHSEILSRRGWRESPSTRH